MNTHEREYIRLLMRKRDEYLRARDEEHIVPPFSGYRHGERFIVYWDADGVQRTMREDAWAVEQLLSDLRNEWRQGR